MNREQTLHYLAGFFDGEGTIGIWPAVNSEGRVHHRAFIRVDNLDRRPLDLMAAMFGGNVLLNGRLGRPLYYWQAASRRAVDIIAQLRPYLIVKADQADIVIEFQGLIRRTGRPLTIDERAARQVLYERIRDAKHTDARVQG